VWREACSGGRSVEPQTEREEDDVARLPRIAAGQPADAVEAIEDRVVVDVHRPGCAGEAEVVLDVRAQRVDE
jgi:hypothetical protein